jgi:hypothetical protein
MLLTRLLPDLSGGRRDCRCVLRGSLREHLRMRAAVQLASRELRMRTVVQLRGENRFRCPRTSVRDLPGRWRTRVRGSSSALQNEGALPHPEVLARTSTESTVRSLAGRASKDAPKRRQVRPSRLASQAPQDEDPVQLASRAPQDEDPRAARFARAQDEDRCAASRRKLFPVSSHVRSRSSRGRGCGAVLRRCRMKAPCTTALILRCSPAHQLKAQLGPLPGEPRRTHQNGGRCVLRGLLRKHLRMRTAVQLASRELRAVAQFALREVCHRTQGACACHHSPARA